MYKISLKLMLPSANIGGYLYDETQTDVSVIIFTVTHAKYYTV